MSPSANFAFDGRCLFVYMSYQVITDRKLARTRSGESFRIESYDYCRPSLNKQKEWPGIEFLISFTLLFHFLLISLSSACKIVAFKWLLKCFIRRMTSMNWNATRIATGKARKTLFRRWFMSTILMFIYGMAGERSHLITEWGDRKPKNIYLCKNTQNCQKCSAGNLWFLLTKKLPKCLRCWRNNFAFERQINKFTFCAIETVETDEKKLGQRQISRNLFYYWQLLFCRSIDYRAPRSAR